MKELNLTINDKTYIVKIADTDETRREGLKNVKELSENKGMLFVWDSPHFVQMTMEDTLIPLDLIFINDDYEVTKVFHRDDIKDDSLVGKKDTLMVLELNINSGIKVGDEIDLEEDDPKYVMKVLAPDGSTQMHLEGGERIVSRRETKILIKKAKKAYESKEDKDYKSLGKYMFKVLHGLDTRDPEYVDAPNKD